MCCTPCHLPLMNASVKSSLWALFWLMADFQIPHSILASHIFNTLFLPLCWGLLKSFPSLPVVCWLVQLFLIVEGYHIEEEQLSCILSTATLCLDLQFKIIICESISTKRLCSEVLLAILSHFMLSQTECTSLFSISVERSRLPSQYRYLICCCCYRPRLV